MLPEKTLAYEQRTGNGTPLFLIHGFCGNRHIWQQFIRHLPPDYPYVAIDLPGCGESELLIYDGISLSEIAADIRALIEYLKLPKVHFVGHSLGGYVGLAFAEQYSDKLASLVLMHSTAKADNAEKKRQRDRVADFIKRKGASTFARGFVPPLFYPPNIEKNPEGFNIAQEIAVQSNANSLIYLTQAMRDRPAYLEVLANLTLPVKWLIGRQDSLINLENYREQIWLPANSSVHIFNDIGHMGLLEQPQKLAQMLVSFAQSQG